MLHVIDILTDKSDWHIKVFDCDTVREWHKDIASIPLMSDKAWDWCLAEMRDKAISYKETGAVLVLDTGSLVLKSDKSIRR